MEIQLQELIDQIKQDGVAAAQQEAQAILAAAKAEADRVVAEAQAEADKRLQHAKQENDRLVKSGEDALRQAGRNLLISFRESVARELEAVTGDGVAATYVPATLAELIFKVVEGWAAKPDAEDMAVILNDKDLQALEATLLAGLKARMLQGVTLKANDNLDSGFRIAVKDGKAYYDYSAEAVVEMLSGYLSPKVAALLREAEDHG